MTDHPLDNHLWHAMHGQLASYSRGNGRVRLLSPDVAWVAALQDGSPASLAELAAMIPYGSRITVIQPEAVAPTSELEVVHVKPLSQMVAPRVAPAG